jgi:hypothetical protein
VSPKHKYDTNITIGRGMRNTETKQRREAQASHIDEQHDDLNGESIGRTNQPVHEVRLGRVVAAIWITETENGIRHNVTVSRLYRDGDQWKRSSSFGRDDLPLVCKTVDRAHDWIFENMKVTRASDESSQVRMPMDP